MDARRLGLCALCSIALASCQASSSEVDRRLIGSWTCVGQPASGGTGPVGYVEMLTTSDGRFSSLSSASSSAGPGSVKLVGISSGTWSSDGKSYTETAQAFDLHYAEENGAPVSPERLVALQDAANQTMLRTTPFSIESLSPQAYTLADDEIRIFCERRKIPGP